MCNSVNDDLAGLGQDLVQDAIVATMRTVKSTEVPPKRLTHPLGIVGERPEQKLHDRWHQSWRKPI
jgi:hypothetical protein